MYRAYLNNLQPGMDYSFVIKYHTSNYTTIKYKFRTPHIVTNTTFLRIAIGMKLSNNIEAVQMSKMLGMMDVDLALIS